MALIDEVILPVLTAVGIPPLQSDALPRQVFVPWMLDAHSGARTIIRIHVGDGDEDVHIVADICQVPKASRTAILSAMNTLNAGLRWIKVALLEETVIVTFDVALSDPDLAPQQFRGAFAAFVAMVDQHWAELVRAGSRRGKRSKLERDLEGVLAKHGQQLEGGMDR